MNLLLLGEVIAGVAGVLAALTGIWRWFGFGTLIRGTRAFLEDWNGEPAREGRDAVPSFPARMAKVEKRTETLNHELRGELSSRLTLLEDSVSKVEQQTKQLTRNGGGHMADSVAQIVVGVDELKDSVRSNREAVHGVEARLTETDRRITDHRRRNEQQMDELRREVLRRLNATGDDQVRRGAYQSILHELGMDPPPPLPPEALPGDD